MKVQLGALMTTIDEYDGWPTLRAALLFLALTMTRPGDVRHMCRSEVIFPRALWRIPAERTKMRRPHDVPLSRQALSCVGSCYCSSAKGILPLCVSGGDHRDPIHPKDTRGPGGQVYAASLHERTTVIYPDDDASPG
jgi:integrase